MQAMGTRGRIAPLMAGALLLGACAPSSPFAADDPADPALPVAATSYASPFAGQPRFATVEARPWRRTNDLVRRLGGPAGHLREPAEADDPATGGGNARP
ncbi:hypothetical protein STAQ_32000 [Allostella sp. ATCC 35155]|nr:hypothetical protein STAQ_32000 [Stella sp. ATCC 35155]